MRSLATLLILALSSVCWSQTACIVRTSTWVNDDYIRVHCDGAATRRELGNVSKSSAVSAELQKLIGKGLKVQSCSHPNEHNGNDYNCILTR